MYQTVRSPMLKMLYPQKTDCVFEWLSALLNEDEFEEYLAVRKYFDEYLAYSETHMYLLEFYYKNSIRAIRNLKQSSVDIVQLNYIFDAFLPRLSQSMERMDHSAVETTMREFFSACFNKKSA